jgi:hypothetical protein
MTNAQIITLVFIFHGLFSIALLGAISHQAAAVWWPVRAGGGVPGFMTRFRAVKAANYVNAIIVLFVITFALGAIAYPAYRIGARIFMENLRMSATVGSFEVKEHLVSMGLGLLPAYWYFWRQPLRPEHEFTRKMITLILALFVWASFLVGHVLNNVRGV